MICFNRAGYLKRSLESLLQVRGIENAQILLFQDGDNAEVKDLCESYVSKYGKKRFQHFMHPHQGWAAEGAQYIAAHYKHMADTVFHSGVVGSPPGVVIVEEDMIFSADFLEYFVQTSHLLDSDPNLWCITTWNDNGFRNMADDPAMLYRTDFFVGLGWLMPRRLWEEVGRIWPATHWDHFLRTPEIRRGRQCLFPEVPRHYNIGEQGTHVSKDMFANFFEPIVMHSGTPVRMRVDHVVNEATYDAWVRAQLAGASLLAPSRASGDEIVIRHPDVLAAIERGLAVTSGSTHQNQPKVVTTIEPITLAMYFQMGSARERTQWDKVAKFLGLWDGVPARATYHGMWYVKWGPHLRLVLVANWSPFAETLRTLVRASISSVGGLVVEYHVAIVVTRVQFPADAFIFSFSLQSQPAPLVPVEPASLQPDQMAWSLKRIPPLERLTHRRHIPASSFHQQSAVLISRPALSSSYNHHHDLSFPGPVATCFLLIHHLCSWSGTQKRE
ncbi:putative GNT-I family protein [Paratrimastix pyriformis]|uniref:alpha-1,3-mannosyl-glycoprotein 2-beta-N-acetylglucosaminyltransferase n=1 Tax=Paratrimastix pyriformis TaxID=342808 RepID=A0ABQ8U8I5_9EUKA|nr:putative GNT-I family protein [Paratrimastix pyriformis]